MLSGEMGVNAVGEKHLSIFVGHLPDNNAFSGNDTITFFIGILQILVELANVSAAQIVNNKAVLHGQCGSGCTGADYFVGKQLVKIV